MYDIQRISIWQGAGWTVEKFLTLNDSPLLYIQSDKLSPRPFFVEFLWLLEGRILGGFSST